MKKILIVEQTEAVRDRLVGIFERRGCWAVTAATIYEALTLLPEFAPQLVVLGVQLPDGSGLDLLALIKREWLGISVIVVSDQTLYQRRCLAGGADAFLDSSKDFRYLSAIADPVGGALVS